MSLSQVHAALANTGLYYFLILAVWGTWRFIRKQGLDPGYWGALVIAEIILAAQFLIGGYLWLVGFRPARSIHVLYGVVALLALPGVYMYTKGRTDRPEMLMYAVVALITVGLILRAMFTGEVALPGG